MTQPTTSRTNPIRVAIIVLAVALVTTIAFVVFLIWGRDAPTALPAPSPSATPSSIEPSNTPSRTEPTTSPSISETSTSTEPVNPPDPTPDPERSPSQPEPTTVTSAEPSSTSAATPSPGLTMTWEGQATFEHFTVEVVQDDPNPGAELIEGKAGLPVEVCATKSLDGAADVRISTEPWTLQDSDGNVQRPQPGGYEPAFPSGTMVPVSECASGFLTFDYTSDATDYAILVYENGLGDRAVWQFH